VAGDIVASRLQYEERLHRPHWERLSASIIAAGKPLPQQMAAPPVISPGNLTSKKKPFLGVNAEKGLEKGSSRLNSRPAFGQDA
jgi:hypothetical protein